VIFCCWHSIIGSSVITSETAMRKSIDNYGLYGMAGGYLIFNIFYICWFIYMKHSNSNTLKQGKKEYEEKLELRRKEFELKDKELTDKEREYDMMEKDKDVEEINERANSFQANIKNQNPRVSQKVIRNNQVSQQIQGKHQPNNDAALLMQNTA